MQPNLQLLWIPSSTPMSSCPMLTYPGWILLCIHTCLCLWPYAFQLVQCTRYADSTDAFAFFSAKELEYFTNDISANPSNARIPQRGLTQIETKQSTNIPSTLRVFRRSTLTQAMRLERSPVAKFSIENNQKGLRINSKFTSYPKFNGIMIMTILLADTPESDDTECSGASNQQPNKIHERKVEVKLINKPPRSSHHDSTRLHLQQSNFDVYMGAYEIPNNAITILFELKRMGLLHRAFFIGSMYQDTTKTMENSTKQPLFSWLDVLDADALARADAVETLSVEYELWTHLYDLSDAPPHLQYASFNGCVPRSERRLARDAGSTCGDDFYTCDGEWFLCSTPHTDFVSIVFAESLQFESPGAYHQLRQTFPWTVSLREKITSFESVGSVCTLRVGGTRTRNTASSVHATTATCPYISLLPVLLTFTIVLLDAESIQQPITFTVHMKYTNYAHVLDLVQIRIIPNAGGISPPIRGLSCNQEYPMICHFVYIHEWIMHEQDFENHDVLHGEMHIWGITYAKQFIRNVSAVLVPLTLHEYDGVVQRRMVLRDWNALIHSALSLPMGTMLRLVLPTFNTSFTTSKTSLRALLRTPHAQPDATGTTLESIVRRSTIMQNLRSTTATLTYASYLASIIPPCARTGTVQSGSASGCVRHRHHDNDSTTMTPPPHTRTLLIPALVGCISGALLVLCIVAVSHHRIHCARSFCMGNLHVGRCGSTLLVGDIIDCQALIRRGDSCSEMELESLGASDMNDFR